MILCNFSFYFLFFSTLVKKKHLEKMFIDLNPRFLFVYFENGLSYERAKKLSSRTLVRCIRFLCSQTYIHNSEKVCYCYKGRLARLLIDLLHNRGHLPLICVMANNNYLRSDRYIVEFFNKIKEHLV